MGSGKFREELEETSREALEAEEVFRFHPAVFMKDDKHSHSEERYNALGLSEAGRELFH